MLPHARLTARELQVFQMLAEGLGINEIAAALSLSAKTVSTHKANILGKMDIASTAGWCTTPSATACSPKPGTPPSLLRICCGASRKILRSNSANPDAVMPPRHLRFR